jgi:transcriptional regulator
VAHYSSNYKVYTPAHFEVDDRLQIVAFMRRYNFAALVSVHDGKTTATHAPLVVRDEGKHVHLIGHVAKANNHWKSLAIGTEVLVIFTGPHGYVSPSLYESKLSVPTWNYTAVHAYGTSAIVHAEPALRALIETAEPAYRKQFDELPPDFRAKMIDGVVAFEIRVDRLEGKFKLSQNRPMGDRLRVAAAFEGTELGEFMKGRLKP